MECFFSKDKSVKPFERFFSISQLKNQQLNHILLSDKVFVSETRTLKEIPA